MVVLMVVFCYGLEIKADGAAARAVVDDAVAELAAQAEQIRPLVRSGAARELLDQVPNLSAIEPRVVWFRREPRAALCEDEYLALPESEREGFERMDFDTRRYYETFYGTPLVSLRAFDLAAEGGGIISFRGRHVLDIGYGSIGQLRLLAGVGAEAVGLEVEPLLHALYREEGDDEKAEQSGGAGLGSLRLVLGLWPRDVVTEVGGGYDLIISKNTLKKGYVTPEEPDPRGRGVDLSVPPEKYVQALARALNPGGLVMIYNIGPAPGPDGRGMDAEGNPVYVHMADIRCPFAREMWEEAGFEIVAFDEPDSQAIRQFAHVFGWDDSSQQVDLERDFFASYTLLRKRDHAN
jgi:SAM-dependent methyltransferase